MYKKENLGIVMVQSVLTIILGNIQENFEESYIFEKWFCLAFIIYIFMS